jgi:hypothetical protein
MIADCLNSDLTHGEVNSKPWLRARQLLRDVMKFECEPAGWRWPTWSA